MGNCEFCATSTVERAKVACNRSVRRPTGAALQLRNSAEWNFWTARGALHRIIPAPPRASLMPILTPRIIQNRIHRRGTEEGA
jgi:hypothetical protein